MIPDVPDSVDIREIFNTRILFSGAIVCVNQQDVSLGLIRVLLLMLGSSLYNLENLLESTAISINLEHNVVDEFFSQSSMFEKLMRLTDMIDDKTGLFLCGLESYLKCRAIIHETGIASIERFKLV